MPRGYSFRPKVCVQSHNLLREKPLKFVEDDSNNKGVVVRDGVEERFERKRGGSQERPQKQKEAAAGTG